VKQRSVVVLLAVLFATALAGCGDLQRRAAEAQVRIENAEEQAQVAQDAAARNTGTLLELERRVSGLEAAVKELQSAALTASGAP